MSDQHEINRALEERNLALEARIAELEHWKLAAEPRGRLPRARISRRVAVLGLALALLLPGVVLASHRFSDVPDSNQFHNDIDWLADYGITTGYGDGTYRPGQAVTRQAMAAFMHRLSNQFEVVNTTVDPIASFAFDGFAVCPGDKRPIAGGGYTSSGDLLITSSFPSGSQWRVYWESDNNVVIDPSNITVWVLCAPRL
ncbi:MAG: S-layer homology domain-containing protein [Candidatus Limnocylindrales bacterium]